MGKYSFKMKVMIFLLMMAFMFIYSSLFGQQNTIVGIMIVLAAIMNLRNDLSFKPLDSFLKILFLLLILGIASFLNNPITIWGCALTFIVVFGTTFTSYHLFGSNVYMPYLLCYFMMMCKPVSIEDLPLRLSSLVLGAAFIVGLNLIFNKKKDYNPSEDIINGLTREINKAIDLKLNGEEVSKENFEVANSFYLKLFSRFEYKYVPKKSHESELNLIMAFQSIGMALSNFDFSKDELRYMKYVLSNIENIEIADVFKGIEVKTKEMNLVLLSLEVIVYEHANKGCENESVSPDRNAIKWVLMRRFSFKSVKFRFAFKMALILTLWEVLTLIFNLPYTKWLYFASIPLMLPYVNDVAYTARSRLGGTILGVFTFVLIVMVMPYIPLSSKTIIMIAFVVCMFGMSYSMGNKFRMAFFTTILSVMSSLMYINLPQAIALKILWVVVAIVVVSIFNFVFLPYSVEKETSINLEICFGFNRKSISMIKEKCLGESSANKTTMLVITNIVRENIEVTDDNSELYQLQGKINNISHFILTFFDVHEFSQDAKEKIVRIIDDGESFEDSSDIYERVMFYSTSHLMKLFNMEKEMM